VQAAAGSFPRTFNQNTGFVKISGLLTPRNNSPPPNTSAIPQPARLFNTPTSTGDGLSLTDGALVHFAQIHGGLLDLFRFIQ